MNKFLFPVTIASSSSDPPGTFEQGTIYYNSSLNTIRQNDGSFWHFMPSFSSIVGVPIPQLVSGLRICPYVITYSTNTTPSESLSSNTSYWIPFSVNRKISVIDLAINVTTATTGSYVTLGIYSSKESNLYPNILLTSVVLSTSTAGLKIGTLASPLTLYPDLYWMALAANIGPMVTSIQQTTLRVLGFSSPYNLVNHYRNTGTTLPSIAPTSGYTAALGNFPLVLMQISL